MFIAVDERDPRPIYMQILSAVKDQVRQGLIKPGDELPSVRELADSLGVNLHTVHRAYQRLRDEGIILLRLGQKARVAPLRALPASREEVDKVLVARLRELITESFHLGMTPDGFRDLVDELLASGGKQSEA